MFTVRKVMITVGLLVQRAWLVARANRPNLTKSIKSDVCGLTNHVTSRVFICVPKTERVSTRHATTRGHTFRFSRTNINLSQEVVGSETQMSENTVVHGKKSDDSCPTARATSRSLLSVISQQLTLFDPS